MAMANDVIEIATGQNNERAGRLLRAELERIATRLHAEAEVPVAGVVAGNFLDVAQGVEQQELARLSTSRLMERARRLRRALARMSDGEYGVCSECGAQIPSRRLLAVPDTTSCVGCQSRRERTGGWHDDAVPDGPAPQVSIREN
jgi:RNA polymerase-binding transcription factor DksA